MGLQTITEFKYKNRTTIRVGISIWQNVKYECLNSAKKCNPGAELSLLQMIADLLNLNLVVKVADEPGCGYMQANGNWSGLLGMLFTNSIDITGNLCTLDPRRSNVSWLKHSYPVIQDKQSFLIKAPNPEYKFRVGAPFQTIVWYTLFVFSWIVLFYFTLYYWCFRKRKFKNSVAHSLSSLLKIIFAQDPPFNLKSHVMLVCAVFVGCVAALYSTFVTVAILNPNIEKKPFNNYNDVINLMSKGAYKLADYHKPAATFRCFENCEKLKSILTDQGYRYYDQNKTEFVDLMMNGLLTETPSLIFPQSELWLRYFLDAFKERYKIWLIPDNWAGEARLAYFYRKEFPFGKAMEECIHFMGSYKDNFRFKLFGLSFQAIQKEYIKGEISKKLALDLELLKGPLTLFAAGIISSMVLCIVENIFLRSKMVKETLGNVTRDKTMQFYFLK